jgi:glucosamine-phosphate N-acetyltransferase
MNSQTIKIRQLKKTDLDDGSFCETLSALKSVNLSVDELKRIYHRRINTNIKTFVAILDKKVVGTVSLFIEQKFINSGGLVGHIEDMAVHKRFQSKGIGLLLVNFAIAYAKSKGCYKVILDCSTKNVKFYQKAGMFVWENNMRIDI